MSTAKKHAELKRTLGLFGATVVGLGSILGTGVFVSVGLAAGEEKPEVACPGCPGDFPEWGRSELSAYLASFATDGVAASSLLRACLAADQGYSSKHTAAMELINMSFALDGCRAGVPIDFPALAAEMELDLFGRSDTATTPDWPDLLPVGTGLNR